MASSIFVSPRAVKGLFNQYCSLNSGCGWLLARLHPRQSAARVGLFGVTVFLFECGFMSWSFLRHGYPPNVSPAEQIISALLTINSPLWILIGGPAVIPG
jgi:hypothetical protein